MVTGSTTRNVCLTDSQRWKSALKFSGCLSIILSMLSFAFSIYELMIYNRFLDNNQDLKWHSFSTQHYDKYGTGISLAETEILLSFENYERAFLGALVNMQFLQLTFFVFLYIKRILLAVYLWGFATFSIIILIGGYVVLDNFLYGLTTVTASIIIAAPIFTMLCIYCFIQLRKYSKESHPSEVNSNRREETNISPDISVVLPTYEEALNLPTNVPEYLTISEERPPDYEEIKEGLTPPPAYSPAVVGERQNSQILDSPIITHNEAPPAYSC